MKNERHDAKTPQSANGNKQTENQSFVKAIGFSIKSFLLTIKRQLENAGSGLKKFKNGHLLISSSVVSVSETDLWNTDDTEFNRVLTAGKVENLRIAARKLDGIEVPANFTFSFWKHVGKPTIYKGYTIGREIREGCIIPTIGGGLCQLSNALYDASLKAGFEIIERHKHTKIIKGSLAEQDRDAVVKWSYIDLRFRSKTSFRIEAELSADKLIVRFKSAEKPNALADTPEITIAVSKLNDCYSCGNFACFRYPGKMISKKEKTVTTFILDEKWNEYDQYIQTIATDEDVFIIPLFKNKFIKTDRYNWTAANVKNIKTTFYPALYRALQLRLFSSKKNIFPLKLKLDKKIAAAAGKLIPVESTHVVISQNLVSFLMEKGFLGGRTFDVLMNSLPIENIQEQLDLAHSIHVHSKTLNDFRASQTLIQLENRALAASRFIITPHREIADLFNKKSIQLNWSIPLKVERKLTRTTKILFPGPALGRKGAYEVRQLAKELDLEVVITRKSETENNFWKGVRTTTVGNNPFDDVNLLVYPAYIEHQPRFLLKALAAGLTIITTTACGLQNQDNVIQITPGDYEALKKAVAEQLNLSETKNK